MFRQFALLIVPCLLATASLYAQTTSTTLDASAYEAVYPNLSANEVILKAVAGDVFAQHELSSRLADGKGVPANTSAAAQWYSLAASRGLPDAPSIDSLPNFPIRARAAASGSQSNPPTVNLLEAPHEQALDEASIENSFLGASLDASGSTSAATIARYIWSIESADGEPIANRPGNVSTTEISLPEPGEGHPRRAR